MEAGSPNTWRKQGGERVSGVDRPEFVVNQRAFALSCRVDVEPLIRMSCLGRSPNFSREAIKPGHFVKSLHLKF